MSNITAAVRIPLSGPASLFVSVRGAVTLRAVWLVTASLGTVTTAPPGNEKVPPSGRTLAVAGFADSGFCPGNLPVPAAQVTATMSARTPAIATDRRLPTIPQPIPQNNHQLLVTTAGQGAGRRPWP